MKTRVHRSRRAGLLVAASLATGTLLQTCEVRMHDALVNGTKLFIAGVLDPDNFIDAIVPPTTDGTDTTTP